MTPMQKVVFDALRPADAKDALGVAAARAQLDTIYGWLDERLAGRAWAAGDAFTLADCAAAPSLLYAQWTHPIPERHAALLSYRKRLLARPSYARALAEARPYRQFFPLGAPETD
jgi:glutathione S-transferase